MRRLILIRFAFFLWYTHTHKMYEIKKNSTLKFELLVFQSVNPISIDQHFSSLQIIEERVRVRWILPDFLQLLSNEKLVTVTKNEQRFLPLSRLFSSSVAFAYGQTKREVHLSLTGASRWESTSARSANDVNHFREAQSEKVKIIKKCLPPNFSSRCDILQEQV